MLKTDTRQANWRRANPAEYDAHLAVGRRGRWICLEKQMCEFCGTQAVDADYDRYDEPLKVHGLCRLANPRLHYCGEDKLPIPRRNK
ncbi:hypothetical protein [Brucella intermedia]|uniref:hypothetical protein n=1 Tax=Brucella intermedia TaxID=94625 RepID=UPI001FCF01A5|nr:hypothetical protein [Brucella intermedia]